MTRLELISRAAQHFPQLKFNDIEAAFIMIIEEMSAALARGDRIEIRGFGSFKCQLHRPRSARNPRSGAPVEIPAKYVPRFRAGKELRAGVMKRS